MKDYARGRVVLIDWNPIPLRVGTVFSLPQPLEYLSPAVESVIRFACAEAIADTKRAERRRAARIVLALGCVCDDASEHAECPTTAAANKILGREKRRAK